MPTMSLGLNHECKVAFQRGQRMLAYYAERSNQKELNAEISLQEIFTALGRTHFHPMDDNA